MKDTKYDHYVVLGDGSRIKAPPPQKWEFKEEKINPDKHVKINSCADLTMDEGLSLIGKEIHKVINHEYELKLIFTDGSELVVKGAMWGDCSLGVEYNKNDESKNIIKTGIMVKD